MIDKIGRRQHDELVRILAVFGRPE